MNHSGPKFWPNTHPLCAQTVSSLLFPAQLDAPRNTEEHIGTPRHRSRLKLFLPSCSFILLLISCCPGLFLLSFRPQIPAAHNRQAEHRLCSLLIASSSSHPQRFLATMGSELGLTADSKPAARLNGIGIWWICWTTGWTLLLLWGMGFLIYQRRMPMLRIRGIGLSLSAISLLHLYWISVQLGYVLGPLYPGDTQYWIMGTYLPLGIGLFHASNTRFLHVAQRQKQYIDRADILNASAAAKLSNNGDILSRFRRLDHTTKVVILVGSGMFFQVSATLFPHSHSFGEF